MSITRRTVLVLGAGASQPYGFPLGPALRDIICAQTTDFRSQITLRSFGFERGEIDAFGTALRHSGFGSIDAFLEAEPRFTSLGKVAIALALLPRERPSALFPPAAPKKGHWYEYLLSITAGSLKEWAANRLTIASFNYDRSFEHYFVTVLAQRFKVSKADAAKLLRRVEVIHLHGQLGAYPGLGAAPVPYDPDSVSSDDVRRAARSITTTFEGTADSPFTRVGKRIAQATRLYFLGFGFADKSMERLVRYAGRTPAVVGGTSKGVPDREWARVTRNFFQGSWVRKRSRSSVLAFLRSDVDLTYDPGPWVG